MGVKRVIFGVIALALLGGMGEAQEARNSALDRLSQRADLFGWEAVGKVTIGAEGYCTGVLIAPDLVLTAGHCIYDRRAQGPRDPATLGFAAAQTDGAEVAARPVVAMVADPDYNPFVPLSIDTVRHDVALLQLSAPIPTSIAAPFRVGDVPAAGAEVSVVSYAQGRADALSWQKACRVFGRAKGLIGFDCDVDHGSSGAPVFDRSGLAAGGRAQIVSLVSSGSRRNGVSRAYGMELPAIVAQLKSALRSGRGVIRAASPSVSAAPQIRRTEPGQGQPRILSGGRTTGAKFLRP
ncbi:hypothetical protein B6V74_08560 [Thioclava sp. F42-5]|uniref:trypsin-like serine peptidase n=1 Tax=Thioclava sp. F42-5 TaxID=1973005 RepID=UPI000B72A23D|nr:serine protease [Thioclava sp. F42-5]OWY10039.1 hypothetical protein B6V74_08560 [Thioclava sp. F42-5]